MAYKVFTNGSVLQASEINDNLMRQSVMVFSNAAARTAAITSPLEGMLTWLEDTNRYENYNGTAWVPAMGKILQVVSATKTDSFSTNSTSFVDVTGLSVNITPTSTSSKFLVSYSVYTGTSSEGEMSLNLNRDATPIAQGTGSNPSTTIARIRDNLETLNQTVTFLDSPATASAITYKVQAKMVGTGIRYVNRRGNDTVFIPVSSITVMEIRD